MQIDAPHKGDILVARPELSDSDFGRAIVYIAEHSDQRSVGFIINKPSEYLLNDFIDDLPENIRVYHGGPVEQENLYFIHGVPELIPNSIAINEHMFWGGDFDTLTEGLRNGSIPPEKVRFFLGYSGWSANQLMQEIDGHSWVIMDDIKNILTTKADQLWRRQLLKLGGEYVYWVNAPENPLMN